MDYYWQHKYQSQQENVEDIGIKEEIRKLGKVVQHDST